MHAGRPVRRDLLHPVGLSNIPAYILHLYMFRALRAHDKKVCVVDLYKQELAGAVRWGEEQNLILNVKK